MTAAATFLAKLQEAANSPVKSGFNVRITLERNYAQKVATAQISIPYQPTLDESTGDTTFAVPDCLGTDGTPSTLADELELEMIAVDKATVNQGFVVKKIVDRSFPNGVLTGDFSIPLDETIAVDGTTTFSAADSLAAAV